MKIYNVRGFIMVLISHCFIGAMQDFNDVSPGEELLRQQRANERVKQLVQNNKRVPSWIFSQSSPEIKEFIRQYHTKQQKNSGAEAHNNSLV